MAKRKKIPFRQQERLHWKKLGADTGYKQKKVGKYPAELYYGTKRGGQITIWEKGKSKLEHVWPSDDTKKYKQVDEVHFMDYHNALSEWKRLKKSKDAINLMWRNR